MTIRKHFEKSIYSRGLSEQEASAIMDICEADTALFSGMEHRWKGDTEDYPPSLLVALQVSISSKAVAWIDANCPLHWARGLFTTEKGNE